MHDHIGYIIAYLKHFLTVSWYSFQIYFITYKDHKEGQTYDLYSAAKMKYRYKKNVPNLKLLTVRYKMGCENVENLCYKLTTGRGIMFMW